MKPGFSRVAALSLQPPSDGPATEEGEPVGAADGEPEPEGVTGETEADGVGVTESRDVAGWEPAGLASLALQAVSHTTHIAARETKRFMR
jgi:hypothetical protein